MSWRTILNKRPAFRAAFDGFDFHKMARYGDGDIARLLADAGIVRHRGKIAAVINNAARAVEMVADEGSLAAFFWRFEPPSEALGAPQTQSTSPSSARLSKELKRRGWRFVGPTTAFAFMQAMGLINDHATGCAMRPVAEDARRRFVRPGR